MSSNVETDYKIYNTNTYKKNRDKIVMKLKKEKLERLAIEVKNWKQCKLLDPFCLCPFYDPNNNKKYND
jgi:predicted nucleic acid-binding Zn finger protein